MNERLPNTLGDAKGAEGLGNLRRRLEEPKPVVPERKIPKKGAPSGVADSVLADKFEQHRRIEEATRDTMRFHGKIVELNDSNAIKRSTNKGKPSE